MLIIFVTRRENTNTSLVSVFNWESIYFWQVFDLLLFRETKKTGIYKPQEINENSKKYNYLIKTVIVKRFIQKIKSIYLKAAVHRKTKQNTNKSENWYDHHSEWNNNNNSNNAMRHDTWMPHRSRSRTKTWKQNQPKTYQREFTP